jgi:hypothetical protein
MNEKIRRMQDEIRKRGGMVHVSDTAPDDVVETFLQEVLACSCCADPGSRQAIDQSSAPLKLDYVARTLPSLGQLSRKRGH